jgi:hypothetical protein
VARPARRRLGRVLRLEAREFLLEPRLVVLQHLEGLPDASAVRPGDVDEPRTLHVGRRVVAVDELLLARLGDDVDRVGVPGAGLLRIGARAGQVHGAGKAVLELGEPAALGRRVVVALGDPVVGIGPVGAELPLHVRREVGPVLVALDDHSLAGLHVLHDQGLALGRRGERVVVHALGVCGRERLLVAPDRGALRKLADPIPVGGPSRPTTRRRRTAPWDASTTGSPSPRPCATA